MPRRPIQRPSQHYWQLSQEPLHSLLFLLPLLVLYELGTVVYATDYQHKVTTYIKARQMLLGFFEWFGLGGFYLPGLVTAGLLIGWHVYLQTTKREPWRFAPWVYAGMLLESALLALPLYAFMTFVGGELVQPAQMAGAPLAKATWQAKLVFSIGAGIYEELVFRLLGLALLHAVLVDLFKLPDDTGKVAAIGISAVCFALYHFAGDNPFTFPLFLRYTTAGVYFAVIYLWRGFGLAAGSHALYDVMVVVREAV